MKDLGENVFWLCMNTVVLVTFLVFVSIATKACNEDEKLKAEVEKHKMSQPGYRLVEVK